MKTQIKTVYSASLVLILTMTGISESSATLLTEGHIGSSVTGGKYIDTNLSSFGTNVGSADVSNPSGPVSHNYPPPQASPASPWPSPFISGFADPGAVSLGTLATTHRDNSRGSITSAIGNSFTVGTGTSGLADGEATQLIFKFSVDGATKTSTDKNTVGSKAIATTSSVFRIWDPTQEEIDFRPFLLDFSAYIWDETETLGDGSRQFTYDWRWKAERDLSYSKQILLDSDSGNSSHTLGYNDSESCLGSPENPSCNSIFDTGLLTFTIDTFVGADLNLWGWMQSGSNVSDSGYAYNNFLNTMGGSITAADGIELGFAIQPIDTGPVTVPEPVTLLLFGTGLAYLAGIRRNRGISR